MKRSPYDGHPFYCKICGSGWDGYLDCKDGDCELESTRTAAVRKKTGSVGLPSRRAAELVAGDKVYMYDNSVRTVKEMHHGHGHIPKGVEDHERCCMIVWVEGEFSMLLRSEECLLVEQGE